eukprot:2370772-Karenia_brevis.AAC.1
MIHRFTSKEDSAKLVDLYGGWMHTPRLKNRYAIFSCIDSTMLIDDTKIGNARVTQIKKQVSNNCYVFLPFELGAVVPEWVLVELRIMLCTSFAGAADARRIDIAYESLAYMDEIMPPVEIVYVGNGGNSKTARSLLRNSVFKNVHSYVAAECFQKPDEFRKQG